MPIYGRVVLCIALILAACIANAEIFNGDDQVLGVSRKHSVEKNESLIEIGRKFGVGYNAIAEANPYSDPFVPVAGSTVMVPTSWVVPRARPTEGMVVNLSEMRLYYFFSVDGTRLIVTFPIGIGSELNSTPLGEFQVVEKLVDPPWHVPRSIKKEKPWLPDVVPPGPENPLGSHAMRLSKRTLLIHGTDKPWAVGRKASHGCLRLYPEHIPRLFSLVDKGARVSIVRQPVKVGVKDGRVYLEVHDDREADIDYYNETAALLASRDLLNKTSKFKLVQAVIEKRGVPVDITK